METHGQRLRRLREKRGLTQVQLQEAAGVDQSTLSGIEKHNAMPKWDTLVRIATAMGVTPDHLMTGRESPAWPFTRLDIGRVLALNPEDLAYVEGRLTAALETVETPNKDTPHSSVAQHTDSSVGGTKKVLGRLPGELIRTGQGLRKSGEVNRPGDVPKARGRRRA